MLRALPPPSYSRASVILSRYRPIAPKPDTLPSGSAPGDGSLTEGKIHQSRYQRNLWPQLQARPSRTWKRGRAPATALSSSKRHRATSSIAHASVPPPLQYVCGLNHAVATVAPKGTNIRSLATLPLLPGLDVVSPPNLPRLDYQTEEFVTAAPVVPEEKDLLRQLQVPCMASHQNYTNTDNNSYTLATSPHPVRPVGSSFIVGNFSEYPAIENPPPLPRKASEVEEGVGVGGPASRYIQVKQHGAAGELGIEGDGGPAGMSVARFGSHGGKWPRRGSRRTWWWGFGAGSGSSGGTMRWGARRR